MLPTRLRGARAHNLRGVDLEIRPGEVTVLTGVSGAGKSSLALDTLYAEGQRRFVESFSPYARQFLERLERPQMDSLEPVAAGVAVDRSAPVKSSRSTVATMADLEPYLAGLFAKESVPHCPDHGEQAHFMDLALATESVLARFKGQQVLVTAPLLVGDREEYLGLVEDLFRQGHRRAVVGGEVVEIESIKPSAAEKAGRLYVIFDRVLATADKRSRLREALEGAFRRSQGILSAGQSWIFCGTEEPLHLREGLSCPTCARGFLPPKPGYFSYESPLGACDNCRGFGRVLGIDLDRVLPDESLSLAEGAIRPWRGPKSEWERRQLKKFCAAEGIPFDVPWEKLSRAHQKKVIDGSGKRGNQNYWGVTEWFEWLSGKAYKMHVRVLLSRYRSYDPCPVCAGTRLNAASCSYKFGGLNLPEWHGMEVERALGQLEGLSLESPHGQLLLKELVSRLRYLSRVGLGYLTLDRQARTLSGGESQRVTLTAALGTSLHNALFVLDEPTVGLHAADILPLTELVAELAARDNAVVVIEHEPLVIARADRVVELGPGAGELGGELTFDGTPAQAKKAKTATARALVGPKVSAEERPKPSGVLSLTGASAHNLKNIDVSFPLGQLVAVSGPSGSGKSSLVVDVLYRALARNLRLADAERPGPHLGLEGAEQIRLLELVDQSPLGRTSRGNAATYTKCWDALRKAFAAEPQAVLREFTASHFSFNVAGGRCEACSGEGHETVEMQFLADVSLVCPVCSGRRFKPEVLEVRFRDLSIADVLELTVEEAVKAFADMGPVRRALAPLQALGLGYVRLGQPLSTLSGGEAQRLKLARALAAPKKDTLYILDEPSAGLHADEIALLVDALRVLVRAGGTVIFVDHDLSLITSADHVIELGPGGGAAGGELVFSGPPEALVQAGTKTGQSLSEALGRRAAPKRVRLVPARPELTVTGAREHTLKDVSVVIPHQQMTVVTGPSGSGKSTLAFDVVFAEGQRRFLETLTPYARRFLPTMPRPHVDAVDGVPPSIALEQRTTRIGGRSTVATITEVAHYLRLLFAKVGVAYCPDHDVPIRPISEDDALARLTEGAGVGTLMAPVVRARKGTYLDVFTAAQRAGFAFAVADGKRVSTDDPPRLHKTKEHNIDVVLRDSVRLSELGLGDLREALKWGQGTVVVETLALRGKKAERREVSLGGSCPSCGFSATDIDPRYFSFNTRQGQCERCEGTGFEPVKESRKKAAVSEKKVCKSCGGQRLSPFARKVQLAEKTYPELSALSISGLLGFLSTLAFSSRDARIAEPIVPELLRRLQFLEEVGLEYLTLDRDARTLSGGELQRLRLAAQLGAGLTGALYVLDEPTIGLHPRDTTRLIGNLKKLVGTGSTVLMVEHDEEVIRAADHLIDLGPGGGSLGGELMITGTPAQVLASKKSPTGLAFRQKRALSPSRPIESDVPRLRLEGATEHNLVGDTLEIPLGRMTVVCGVSGSGKSTLIGQVLLPALAEKLERTGDKPGAHRRLSGTEHIRRAISVDQSPIGRTPRSIPATFLGIFDHIRNLYAKAPDAQVRGFSASRFSFNTSAGGRCATCEGQGVIAHEMSFLPDVVTPCPSCDGQRFEERTLEAKYLGLSIGEVLKLSASEAVELFSAHPKIARPLQVLCDLGAGYITLGQGSHTLSGGEAQRLKLSSELCAGARHEPTLYVLDEPTTGLHLSDVGRLVEVLSRLIDRGDTLVVIEHQLDVIRSADWVVELGPSGGPGGGQIVFSGAPNQLIRAETATGQVLRQLID